MDYLESLGSLLGAAKPNVVITAPDGAQLWTRVALPDGSGSADSSSLFSGYSVKLTVGDAPQSPNITTNAAAFAASQGGRLALAWLTTPAGLATAGLVLGLGAALLLRKR